MIRTLKILRKNRNFNQNRTKCVTLVLKSQAQHDRFTLETCFHALRRIKKEEAFKQKSKESYGEEDVKISNLQGELALLRAKLGVRNYQQIMGVMRKIFGSA